MTDQPPRRAVVPDDLFLMRWLQSAAIAPDGQAVAYAVASYDADAAADYAHLWLLHLATGQARQLTYGQQEDKNPQWSPDGRHLAFTSTRGGKAQLFILPVDGGEARQITQLPQGVGGGLAWSPDGSRIAFTAGPPPPAGDSQPRPYRITRDIYRFDGIGYLDPAVQDIYVVAATGAQAPMQLTSDLASNNDPQWSPDGREILYSATMLPDSLRCFHPRLRVVDLQGQVREVVDEGMHVVCGAWLPDGQHIVFAGAPEGLPIGSKSDLYLASAAGRGEISNRSAGLAVGVANRLQADMPSQLTRATPKLLVAPDGQSAVVQVQEGGRVALYQIALHGPEQWRCIAGGERACIPLDISRLSGSVLFAASDWHEPLDLWLLPRPDAAEQRLTTLNADLLAGLQQAQVERLLFSGPDGAPVEGWMIMPADGQPPFPTVLYIHGGPHGAFGAIYHFDSQMLLGAGMAVLMINQRASTGYGDPFATAIKGDWGNLDYGDLMAGLDEAIARQLADGERLGVCGVSGGGNLSCWIVSHTHRFKAAVPENPVTNWLSFYGVSDVGVWFAVEELGGHPHEIPEVYRRCSPITYAHHCRTPTLLVQGESDWRCPAEQSEQFYTVLKANGCPVEMLRLPDSSHTGSRVGKPAMRRAQNEALLEWMLRYVV
ncbi:MAG TPA: S9 family peptidase [Anaerolineae bacterium]|nr:S9 family peptidase [Anaerolineae bacterium]